MSYIKTLLHSIETLSFPVFIFSAPAHQKYPFTKPININNKEERLIPDECNGDAVEQDNISTPATFRQLFFEKYV